MDALLCLDLLLLFSVMPLLALYSSLVRSDSDDWDTLHCNQHCILCIAELLCTTTCWNLLMENSLLEILTYYVIGGALLIGAPGIFFLIVFMPALQNTKGRMVGYKDHKLYGDSSIYENTKSDTNGYFLQVSGNNPWHLATIILLKRSKKQWTKKQNASTVGQRWSESSQRWVVTQPQVKLSQVCGERYVIHSSIHGRRVRICCPIDRWRRWWWWQWSRWWSDDTSLCTKPCVAFNTFDWHIQPCCLNKSSRVIFMPRNQLTKDQIKCDVLKLKNKLKNEYCAEYQKEIADMYLNLVLDKIDEYRL